MKNFEKNIDKIAMSLYELNIFLKGDRMVSAGCLIFEGEQNDPEKIKEWLLKDCEEEKKFKLTELEYNMLMCSLYFYDFDVRFYTSNVLMALKDCGHFKCFNDMDIRCHVACLLANSEVVKEGA